MRSPHLRLIAAVTLTVALIHPAAEAQTPAPTDWSRVQALPAQTILIVRTDTHKFTCSTLTVTDDKLTCSQQAVSRAEIKNIKLRNKTKSTVSGLLLGAAIGAGVGAGIGSAINSGDSGEIIHVSGGKSAGVGAGVGAIVGIGIGALVGHSTDLFASTIYKR